MGTIHFLLQAYDSRNAVILFIRRTNDKVPAINNCSSDIGVGARCVYE